MTCMSKKADRRRSNAQSQTALVGTLISPKGAACRINSHSLSHNYEPHICRKHVADRDWLENKLNSANSWTMMDTCLLRIDISL